MTDNLLETVNIQGISKGRWPGRGFSGFLEKLRGGARGACGVAPGMRGAPAGRWRGDDFQAVPNNGAVADDGGKGGISARGKGCPARRAVADKIEDVPVLWKRWCRGRRRHGERPWPGRS